MSSKERKILDISIAPQRLNEFRESLQGAFETCDAKAYAEYIAEDVRRLFAVEHCSMIDFTQIEGTTASLVTDKHLARTLSRNEPREELPINLRS